MTTYRHSQIGHAIIFPVIAIALAAAVFDLQKGLGVAAILLLVAVIFHKLTIEIDDTHMRAKFGPGLTFRRIRLVDICDCKPIRIHWWYGWGIHLTPYGWLYNVSGWDAVAITLHNGRRLAFGTNQPEELCAAIRRFASAR